MTRTALLIATLALLGLGETVFGQTVLPSLNGLRVVVPPQPTVVTKPGISRLPNGRWIVSEIIGNRGGIRPTPQPTPLPYPTPQPQPTPLPYPTPSPQPVPQPQPQPHPGFIPPSQGQYPIYVTPNEVVGVNPHTGGLDTQNRQIDNTVLQHGRNESQNNGTKRWVRRPIHNAHGQVVGYQEGWVWNNSYTGQEHGELVNYTPNGQGGVNEQYQSRSVQGGGVHKNIQSFGAQPTRHSPTTKTSPALGGVHKNLHSFSIGSKRN